MAKIAVLTRKLTAESLGLAQALQFHRHEIILVTSALETVPDQLGFQVLTYFRNWSAWEALRLFPRLLSQAPEVWHFVFSDTELEQPSAAHWVLANLARALPGRVVAASFYDSLGHLSRMKAQPLLKSCDIVTTATRENLMLIKRRSWLNPFCETEVLPPFLPTPSDFEKDTLDQDLRQLTEAAAPYLVVPSEKLPPRQDWSLILNKVCLVVCGPRPAQSPEGVFYVGHHLSASQWQELLSHSRGLLTAFDDFSLVELLNFHRLCSLSRTLTLAHPRQTEALPGFCVNKRNGFLIQHVSQLNQLLLENPELSISSPLFDPIKTDLADSALNELNRLYSKVRHIKSSSVDFKRGPLP